MALNDYGSSMSVNQVAVGTAMKRPEPPAIHAQAAFVANATDRLQMVAKELTERLMPVLGPERPALAGESEKPQSLSTHASFLREQAAQLHSLAAHLEAVLARLEV